MRDWEKASWAAGRSEAEVIARVSKIVAHRAAQLTRPGDFIVILAGKGHNGDDARLAREHLADRRVYLCNVSAPDPASSEFKKVFDQRPQLIIDGLFGIGLNRPLDAKWSAFIHRINELKTRVLAVDVPSGLNAETGQPEGAAIRATVTLTLGAPKRGMLQPSAWPFVGRLEVAPEIGLVPCPLTSDLYWVLPEDFRDYPPERPAVSHKGDYGRLTIVAGSLGYHGAAVLTSRGAQRAQPGLITLYTSEPTYHPVASQLQAVMVSLWQPIARLPGPSNAILAGPGLAAEDLPEELKAAIGRLWRESPTAMVVDASALVWLPQGQNAGNSVRVITPHPGEAARLLRSSAQEVQADRPAALRELSRRMGDCWVVLKGQQTLIGRSTGDLYVNSSGDPRLAQGGSGDVLAGFLAGLLAQPALQGDALKAILYGVWQHGAAADQLTAARNNWVVEDLVSEIGNRRELESPSEGPQSAIA
jgi:ADP-dependent NAD(P)H-hydrate dehydratase / NAD(P)H-hydrate epimerase